jgi:hypothetical protein
MNARTCWRTIVVLAIVAVGWSAGLGAQSKGKAVSGPTTIRVDGNTIKS